MDPSQSAQDVLRCDLCETPAPPMYCDMCYINLCKACVGEHLVDASKEHKVVPFEKRGSMNTYPNCRKHSTKICELHCNQCDIPICTLCVSSGDHEQHKKEDILKTLAKKKEILKKDLQELENSILPNYKEAASNIPCQKDDKRTRSKELSTALKKHGEVLHKEIDIAIQKMQSKIDGIDAKDLAALDKKEIHINHTIEELSQVIFKLKRLLQLGDFRLISEYTSRNDEFRSLPVQVQEPLPTCMPQEINEEQIYQLFGLLSVLAQEDLGAMVEDRGKEIIPFSSPARLSLEEPQTITDIKIKNTGWSDVLNSVSCPRENEFWACGTNKIISLYNLQGEMLEAVQIRSKMNPFDITVTKNEELVYADAFDESINIIQDKQIHTLIKLPGWIPRGVCSSSSGDLLAALVNEKIKQTKVVRFSGSEEKQTIQWDDHGQPIYSCTEGSFKGNTKYLSENRNLDICMADSNAHAVVVVNEAGKTRFRYSGPPYTTKKNFKPRGITTDSQGNILAADYANPLIHMLDQDGHFLRYIDTLNTPWGICVDSRDNLFVVDHLNNKVKIIKYYK